jgi:hypothetical protein
MPVRTNHTDGGSLNIETLAFTLSETGISDSELPDLSDSDSEVSGTPGLKPCNACLPHETMGCYRYLSSSRPVLNSASISALHSAYSSGSRNPVLAHKPVAKKVRAVSAPLKEEYHVIRRLPDDPLAGLIPLPTHPPAFTPGIWFMQERSNALDLDPAGWLWPEELKLVQRLVRIHEKAFAWIPTERGRLDERYFPPVKIPTIQHTPWVVHNMPIPAAIQQDVIQIIKDWIALGVYEPSTAAYRSRWFCVLKGDGKSLRLVHDLQPLNAVTIRDASTPLFVEQLTESFAGYAVYGMMDLFAGYDQRPLHVESQDMTTFSSPLRPQWLTMLPMGYTNVVQIYQADMSFILQEEIPHYTMPFIDDLPVKSGMTRYQDADGSYETMPAIPGIRRFIWEHLIIVNQILQHLQNVGATVSAKKFVLAAPDAVIVGHKCTFEGQIPHEAKVQKIQDWPECASVMHVHGFLGTYGVLRIFIRNFAAIARPLVNLTRKGVPFEWGESQQKAMQHLKDEIIKSPALRRLDYASGREVILAVDTSVIVVGYILSQEGDDGKRYPNRFGSLSLTEIESRYSQ